MNDLEQQLAAELELASARLAALRVQQQQRAEQSAREEAAQREAERETKRTEWAAWVGRYNAIEAQRLALLEELAARLGASAAARQNSTARFGRGNGASDGHLWSSPPAEAGRAQELWQDRMLGSAAMFCTQLHADGVSVSAPDPLPTS